MIGVDVKLLPLFAKSVEKEKHGSIFLISLQGAQSIDLEVKTRELKMQTKWALYLKSVHPPLHHLRNVLAFIATKSFSHWQVPNVLLSECDGNGGSCCFD